MEGLLPILLFIAFAIASVLEKAGKKPGGPEGGNRPRPGQRPGQPRQRQQRLPPPASRLPPASGRADEMIPEDFWRELTGQARVPRAPPPVPVPVPEPDLSSWDEGAAPEVAAARDEEDVAPETFSLEEYRREVVLHEPPVVVSLETPPLPSGRRHAAFHARRDELPAPPTVTPPALPAAGSLVARLRRPGGARDAFVLTAVLGRPKGLE